MLMLMLIRGYSYNDVSLLVRRKVLSNHRQTHKQSFDLVLPLFYSFCFGCLSELYMQRHIGCAPSFSLSCAVPQPLSFEAQVVVQQSKKRTQNTTDNFNQQPQLISFLFTIKKSFDILYYWDHLVRGVLFLIGLQVQIERRKRGNETHSLFRRHWLNSVLLKLIVCFFSFSYFSLWKKIS